MNESEIEALQMQGQDIGWLLQHWANNKPDHAALVWDAPDEAERTWTYAELFEATNQLAAGLTARDIGRGDKVLIHADNCPEMMLVWLACAVVGAVGVTTNTRSAPPEVAWFVDHSGCVAAITQPKFAAHVGPIAGQLRWVATIGAAEGRADTIEGAVDFSELYGEASDWPGRPIDPMLPFGIMFTSGTTNKPKAVVHTHANAVWASRSGPRSIDLGTEDRYLVYLPLFHVNAQSWSFFSALGVGATIVLTPKWSLSRFWDLVTTHEITHISLMPFVFPALSTPDRPKSKLRVGVFGLIMPQLSKMFGIDIYAAYGMTETVTHAVSAKPSEYPPDRSMGHATPGYEFMVIDKETGAICAVGETGELWLRGTRGIQLFLEYFNNEEANAKAFEGDWFKTGDMVMLGEGGNLFYRERDKDLLKVGGENVSAKEVEDIVQGISGVAQVAVVGKAHEFLSEVVVAYVIKGADGPNEEALKQEVIDTCSAQLSDFKVPRAVYFVSEFPTGTLDKILKNRLREMADEHPPV